MSKRKEYEKKIKQMIQRYEKSGYSKKTLNKFLDNKKPEDFASNARSFNNFKKLITRARTRKSILQESRLISRKQFEARIVRATEGKLKDLYQMASNISKEMSKQAEKEIGRKSVTLFKSQMRDRFPQFQSFIDIKDEGLMRNLIWEMKMTPVETRAKEIVHKDMLDFLEKYFNEVTVEYGVRDRLEKIAEHFGGDYVKMDKFITYVTQPSFTGFYDSDQGKEDPESFYDEMLNRLSRMESILNTNKQFRNRK